MAFTNLVYSEFDTNTQTIARDIVNALTTGSPSWTKVSSTSILVTTTALSAAAATTLTATSGAWTGAGIGIGTIVRIGEWGAADAEYRTVTAVAATTITVAALTYSHASGTNVYLGNEVVKATTTRGCDMIVDLMNTHVLVTNANLNMAVYRSYVGTGLGTPTDVSTRWLYWKNTATTTTSPIHVTLSASKDHLWLQLEGARENETGADSATVGSGKVYFFIDDVVPYFAGDTVPTVFAGGGMTATYAASNTVSMYGHQSRNPQNTTSWEQSKLATLAHPDNGLSMSQHHQRIAYLDSNNYYLAPYVVFGDLTGIRGRLGHVFHAGFVNPDLSDGIVGAPAIGSKVTYGGDTYKLLSANKSAINAAVWGQLGAISNNNGSPNNVVIAVPST